MILVLLPGTFLRFESARTGETLLDARRVGDRHLIVYGTARRDRYDVGLDEGDVRIAGTLWDRWGPAVSFGEQELRFHARVLVEHGVLPDDYDGSWTRDDT